MSPLRWIDKLVFSAVLIATLQLPILTDHYRQYLSGYVDALAKQVNNWQLLATEFEFTSLDAYIRHLEKNADLVVVKEAQIKRSTLLELETKRAGLNVLNSHNYPQQLIYMFSPANLSTLRQVVEHFQPGLPLTLEPVVYSVFIAIFVHLCILMPCWGLKRLVSRTTKSSYYGA